MPDETVANLDPSQEVSVHSDQYRLKSLSMENGRATVSWDRGHDDGGTFVPDSSAHYTIQNDDSAEPPTTEWDDFSSNQKVVDFVAFLRTALRAKGVV